MHPSTHEPTHPRAALRAQVRAGLRATRLSGFADLAWRVTMFGFASFVLLWAVLGHWWLFLATTAFTTFLHLAVFVHGLPHKGDLALRAQAIAETQRLLQKLAEALGQHHKARQTILWMEHDAQGPCRLRLMIGITGIQALAIPGWLMAALEDIAARHHQHLREPPPLTPIPSIHSTSFPFVQEVGNVHAHVFGEGVNVGTAHARLAAVQALVESLPASAQALYTGLDLEPITA